MSGLALASLICGALLLAIALHEIAHWIAGWLQDHSNRG